MEEDAVPALARAFHDGEQVVRNGAMEALWRIGPRATRPVVDMLSDPKSDIRKRAALLLGEIGDISSVEPLARVLTDDSPVVRREVFEAIEMIKIRSGYSRPPQDIKSGEGNSPQGEDRNKKSSW
jgi:HEAT repeat protein